MLLTADLAYFAGLVDGEGSIYLRKGVRGNLQMRLSVVNTNEVLIDWIVSRFGGKKYLVERTSRSNHKPAYHWHLQSQAAVVVLRDIAQYLVAKKPQAELAIYAWENRQPTPIAKRRAPIPDDVVERRAGFVAEMRALNRKGA